MRKFLTLVELLIVIVVLGILAAIVIPNISDMKKEAITSHVEQNTVMLQTAVDRYRLDNQNKFPTAKSPTLKTPELIVIDELYPKYIKKKVDYQKVKGQRYWVDVFGKVWGATADSPNQIQKGDQYIQWERDEKATSYHVYEVQKNETTGSSNVKRVKSISYLEMKEETNRIELLHGNKDYLFSTIDEYGLESAPVGPEYLGFQDGFYPILNRTGIFTFELVSEDAMQLIDYRAWEKKPDGSSISYKFAIQNEKGDYGEFTDEFAYNVSTKAIKVQVDMRATKGQMPSLLNFHVYFGYPQDQFVSAKLISPQGITNILEECKDGSCQYYTPETAMEGSIFAKVLPPENPSQFEIDGFTGIPKLKFYCNKNGNYYESFSALNENCIDPPIVVCIDCPTAPIFIGSKDKPIPNPEPVPENNPTSLNSSNKEQQEESDNFIFYPLKEKGWNTVQTFRFFAHSPDGTKVRWLKAEMQDNQPENTRIVYSFANSDGFSTTQEVDAVDKLSESRSVVITAYLQVKEEFLSNTPYPELFSIKMYSEKGAVDINTVKPSVLLKLTKNNNVGRSDVSTDSILTWDYETSDPRGREITDVEWTGPKQTQYTTPGIYKVGIRVKNSSNYWSDWNYLTLDVKSEQPVSDFKANPSFIETNKTINWDTSLSIDPDGDKIVKYEWEGLKKSQYSEDDIGSHTIRLRVQDEEGNWSVWKERTFRVYLEGEVVLKGLSDSVFDGDSTTKSGLPVGTSYVTWEGNPENRLMRVTITASSESTRLQFLNSNGQALPFILHSTSAITSSVNVNGTVDVVVPEGAVKIALWNRYYSSTATDIFMLGDRKLPSNIQDVTSKGNDYSIDFFWKNPSISDFKEVSFYLLDNTFVGKISTETFTHKPLLSDYEYNYKVTVVDQSGNRSPFIYFSSKTTKPSVAFRGLGPAAFDKDLTTKLTVPVGTTNITWDGNLENRLMRVAISASSESTRIQFFDSTGNILFFINNSNNLSVSSVNVNGSVDLVVPEGAVKMALWNRYYSSSASDIHVLGDETIPANIKNLKYTPYDTSIDFSWDNPSISDFKEVHFYLADNTYVGKSSTTQFTHKPVWSDYEYNYKITVVDQSGNRSPFMTATAKSTMSTVAFRGLGAAAFDGVSTTTVGLPVGTSTVTWIGEDISNRNITVHVLAQFESTRVQFLDANNQVLSFTRSGSTTTMTSLNVDGSVNLVVPEGAMKLTLWNRYYSTTAHDIVLINP